MNSRHYAPWAAATLAAMLLLVACSGNGDPAPTAVRPAPTATTTSVPPVPTATAIAPLPTVEPPALKLRLVNVATGANSELPVGFGRTPAWSPDSTRIAVVDDDGLSFGALAAPRFTRLWKGSCRAVDWSPMGDRIAAACSGALVMLDMNGKVIARDETVGAEWVSFPPWVDWSPDGKLVAYGSANSGVTLMDGNGRQVTVAGSFRDARWLPDGRLLTIEQPTYRDAATVRIHDPARDYAAVVTAVTQAGAEGLGIDREGRYVAYGVYGPAASSGVPRILPSTITVLRVADGQAVASFPTYPGPGYGEIDFSPDGRSVLMQSDYCGPNWALEIGGLDGARRVIARGSAMASKFSPDGAQVGFLRGTELWVVAADGSAPARRIAEGVHGPAGFDWSPDGKWISVPPNFGGFGQCP